MGQNIMQDLHTVGINPFAVTLLAESVLKSPIAPMTVGDPKTFFFPVQRSDCAGWVGVRITVEAVPEGAAIATEASAEMAPIDMVLHCPKCGKQHIDAIEHGREPWECRGCGRTGQTCDYPTCMPPTWTNPPHRSHLCHSCGHIWRPADVPTNGVAEVKTKGKADSPLASPTAALAVSKAARDVLAERRRQVEVEGWTPAHDDEHGDESLAWAAVCYAMPEPYRFGGDVQRMLTVGPIPPMPWPASWHVTWWKPEDPRRNLVKATALLLAEIERRDRATAKDEATNA